MYAIDGWCTNQSLPSTNPFLPFNQMANDTGGMGLTGRLTVLRLSRRKGWVFAGKREIRTFRNAGMKGRAISECLAGGCQGAATLVLLFKSSLGRWEIYVDVALLRRSYAGRRFGASLCCLRRSPAQSVPPALESPAALPPIRGRPARAARDAEVS